MATEGDPYENIAGVYARSSGVVWTTFRLKAERTMTRWQAVQVLGAVWFLMFDHGAREVAGGEVVTDGDGEGGEGLASFVLRFFSGGEGEVG